MAKAKRHRAGGQLNRSETITVRLDPKLNYLCELAARAQRRTKSSLVEAALADALNVIAVDPRPSTAERPSIAAAAETLWDVDEAGRLARLAGFAPHLMTYDEQRIWSVLLRNAYFWTGEWEQSGSGNAFFRPFLLPENLMQDRVAEHWDTIKAVAEGDEEPDSLPQPVSYLPWDDRMTDVTMTVLFEQAEQAAGENDG